MDISPLKSQLKSLLTENLSEGIALFEESLSNLSNLFNEVILIKSRYEQIQLDAHRNVVSFEQKNIVLNKIRVAYLRLVDQIEEQDLKKEPETKMAEAASVAFQDAFYKQNCKDFLQGFKSELQGLQQDFSKAYDEIGKLQIDFGNLFINIGKVLESMKMETGKEEEFHIRFKTALQKSTRRLNLFESNFQPAIDRTEAVNKALLQHYQKLIYYLDFPNPSLSTADCLSAMRFQQSVLDTLKLKSEKLVQSLNFVDQLEAVAYAFKIDQNLEKAFLTILDSIKALRSNTAQLSKQAQILSAELSLSVEEMSFSD